MTSPPPLPGRFEARLLSELQTVVDERRLTSSPTQVRERRPRWRSRPALLLSAAVVLSGGTALAATTPWSPEVGTDRSGHPTLATTPPSAAATAALGALRREQTTADRGARVVTALKGLPGTEFADVNPGSARLLQQWGSGASILIAAHHTGADQLCLLVDSDAATVIDQSGSRPSAGASTGVKCGSVGDLQAGNLFMGSALGGHLVLDGIVPDGVARVEVPLRDGQTVGADVTDNSFHIDAAISRGSYEDAGINWFDKDGNPVPKG